MTSSVLLVDSNEVEILPFFPSGIFKTHLTGEILTGFETKLLFEQDDSDWELVLSCSCSDKSFRCRFARGWLPGSLTEETGLLSFSISGDFV